MVMPSNSCANVVHYWAGKHPGQLGHLYSPGGQKGPFSWLPYAIDNGAYPAFSKGRPWDEAAFTELLAWAQEARDFRGKAQPPLWVVVPDVVADKCATLDRWQEWAPKVSAYGYPLAFAAQDGMTPGDVPPEADVVFMGGTRDWKWANLEVWCEQCPRVHVGRVNTYGQLRRCSDAGVESVDGTGWFRGGINANNQQLHQLHRYLREEAGEATREIQNTVMGWRADLQRKEILVSTDAPAHLPTKGKQ